MMGARNTNTGFIPRFVSGFSLLETIIAISLLGFVASVAVHMVITHQQRASKSHSNARTSVMRDSLAGYIDHAFHNNTLSVADAISKSGVSGLPAHLDADSLDVLPIMGERHNDAACHDIMPEANFAPCGYFIEWGGTHASSPKLAETRSILLDEWAQICF